MAALPEESVPSQRSGPQLRPVPDPAGRHHAAPQETPAGGDGAGFDTAADLSRQAAWLKQTFRPPDVWAVRQPSAREEWEFARAAAHLPESTAVRALARVYAYPAVAGIVAGLWLIWIARSPARGITAVLVCVLAATAAYVSWPA
ncbi:hypothetical protein CLV63_113196 [Murinocardiopsis flavida]|uniref:Uncharacterized protein n=1 Tax=Murinocardiopsis flavida TaxID=645275 RepID=A0A2P8DFP0_9ACTN|nr:hypothetical protein [Murinocardiopsis flavida]PSK96033.1 hypothetical protein CLV63_113196 [Murinocardiopsis flavida]